MNNTEYTAITVTADVIHETVTNLQKNRMKVSVVATKEEALALVLADIDEGNIVGVGGSVTLNELGLIPILRTMPIRFLDRYEPELEPEQIMTLHRALSTSDVFISSSNAITMQGELYNVDGTGNRVTAMAFGPRKVVVVAGINKIVSDLMAARQRVKKIAAPLNNKRLNTPNPCVISGVCSDCSSIKRICNVDVTIRKQAIKDRIHVILVKEALGY